MGRGSMYHGYGDRYTVGTGFEISWIVMDIPWVEGSIHHE
jgi:hypothetical protein